MMKFPRKMKKIARLAGTRVVKRTRVHYWPRANSKNHRRLMRFCRVMARVIEERFGH